MKHYPDKLRALLHLDTVLLEWMSKRKTSSPLVSWFFTWLPKLIYVTGQINNLSYFLFNLVFVYITNIFKLGISNFYLNWTTWTFTFQMWDWKDLNGININIRSSLEGERKRSDSRNFMGTATSSYISWQKRELTIILWANLQEGLAPGIQGSFP